MKVLHTLVAASLAVLATWAPVSQAQTYPAKPIRLVVPGSAAEFGNLIAQDVERLGQLAKSANIRAD